MDYSNNGTYVGTQSRDEYGYTTVPLENQANRMYFYCSNSYNPDEFIPVDVYLVTEKWIDQLYQRVESSDLFVVKKVSSDNITASIHVTHEQSVAFTTLPYDAGWSVWMDGKEVEIKKVNLAFIGFDVSQGDHEVELKFRPFGLTFGMVISGISAAILIILKLKKKL